MRSTCSGKQTVLDRTDRLVGTSETLGMVRMVGAMVRLAEPCGKDGGDVG